MENNTEKFNCGTFRSVTIEGILCKTIIFINKEKKATVIIQRFLFTEQKEGFKLLRKYKQYYYSERHVSLKNETFSKIVSIVSTLNKM